MSGRVGGILFCERKIGSPHLLAAISRKVGDENDLPRCRNTQVSSDGMHRCAFIVEIWLQVDVKIPAQITKQSNDNLIPSLCRRREINEGLQDGDHSACA